MATNTILAGKVEMAINGTVIPPELLGEIAISLEEGTSEADTQAGTIVTPSGKFETAEATFTMYLPSMDYLKVIYPDLYTAPTASSQKTGNVVFGGNTCSTREPVEVNIHYVCENTDDNDIHFEANIVHNFDLTYSTGDPLSIETTMYLLENETFGRLRAGTGDLSQPSYYDASTQTTKPVSA